MPSVAARQPGPAVVRRPHPRHRRRARPETGKCGSIVLGEEIENSFAIARDGAYIVTDKAQYKFRAGADLKPRIVWRATYRNDGEQKAGQFNAGSGTTPTLIAAARAAAARARRPTYVGDHRQRRPARRRRLPRGRQAAQGQKRVVCHGAGVHARAPARRELADRRRAERCIAENNSGYDLTKFNDRSATARRSAATSAWSPSPASRASTSTRDGTGCTKVWTNNKVRARRRSSPRGTAPTA